MKKILSMVLSAVFCVVWLTGCSLFEHDYEKDYAQIIATINGFTQTVYGEKTVLDENGYPIYDYDGKPMTDPVTGKKPVRDENGFPTYDENNNPITEDVHHEYTSNKIDIYKSQLVNYVDYYLPQDTNLQNATTVEAREAVVESAIGSYLDMIVNIELLLIEADKLFDAGVLYWTVAEVEEIQRNVYIAITDSIFETKNTLLEDNDLPKITAKGADPATDQTTYPLPPQEEQEDEVVSPAYKIERDSKNNQWFDAWYTDHDWYIQADNYKAAYPGLYGEQRDRNLAAEAFTNYFESLVENSKKIIGVTEERQKEIDEGIAQLNDVRNKQGIEYVFPLLGKSLAGKYLIGNSYLKNKKLEKLQNYVTREIAAVSDEDVTDYYNKLLSSQKKKYVNQANFDSAVTDGSETILYYPTDKYIFVKHILLPFSDEQKAELDAIKSRYGTQNEDIIEAERAKLASKIIAYPHVNGEDDTTRPMEVKDILHEILSEMNSLKNSPKLAERAFDKFIYKYNTDPGAFNSEKGYAVTAEGESQYMDEFTEAARALRKDFNVGEVYYDYELDVPYCITDYGIHVMYYLMEPAIGVAKELDSYVTPGAYTKIYDVMKAAALNQKQTGVYEIWEDTFLSRNSELYLIKNDKVFDKYVKEMKKLVNG